MTTILGSATRRLLLIAASVLFTACTGTPIEPPISANGTTAAPPWTPTLKGAATTGLRLGWLNIEFEHTALHYVRRMLRRGTINHRGDASTAEAWLCYTLNGREHNARLWLTAGEMQGTEYIGKVTAERLPTGVGPTPQCPSLPPQFRQVALHYGIWLGSRDASIEALFGAPSQQRGTQRWYQYSRPIHDPILGRCEQDNSLYTRSQAGRVIYLQAWQLSSC